MFTFEAPWSHQRRRRPCRARRGSHARSGERLVARSWHWHRHRAAAGRGRARAGAMSPPPAYYAPPPVAYYPPPAQVWVPPHWQSGYWVPGHWA